jgi:(p)ppGpp synthase/HD superfamily hydrolase
MKSPFHHAVDLAWRKHQGKTWGAHPYTEHILRVLNVVHRALDTSFVGPLLRFDEATPLREALDFDTFSERVGPYLSAAVLHDVPEDTDVTFDQIRALCGPVTAQIVEAVTTPASLGNRAKRAEALRLQLRACPEAVPLKLADVLVNADLCWETRHSLLFSYRKNWPALRSVSQDAILSLPPSMSPLLRPLTLEHGAKRLVRELDQQLHWRP